MSTVTTNARARVRAELTREILDVAREQLIERGAHDLSLRAVARALGMAPSGLYRYFAGRDELLTALIIDSYGALGTAAADADAAMAADDHLGRWLAVTGAVWAWAHAHPPEWALIYGSPVPGYRAPVDTVDAARMVIDPILGVVSSAAADGRLAPTGRSVAEPVAVGRAVSGIRHVITVDDAHIVATLAAFAEIIGMVSLHLFGHLKNGVEPADVVWRQMMADQARLVGLRPSGEPVPIAGAPSPARSDRGERDG